ncbi:MAG: zf-TFIIB domain-containing protein [Spirochaetia bacterium]|nr:zf-TFIIB domain-containing protein [Spirochaetia bacterium]
MIKNCPVCKGNNPLKIKEKEGRKIKACNKCNGMYLHKGDLNAFVPHYKDFYPREDVELSSVDHDPHSDTHSLIPCAYCDNSKMIKINFLSMSNIILDYCEKCESLWVDGEEIEKIQSYWQKVENGSVESHDPLNIQVLNFLRSISLLFFKWVIIFSLFIIPIKIKANNLIKDLQHKLNAFNSSFIADIKYTTSSGFNKQGRISYEYPDKLHISLSDNSVIATNGMFLWIYNPETQLCAKQEVAENSGGLFSFLKDYEGRISEEEDTFIFENPGNTFQEIIIKANDEILTEITLISNEVKHTFQFLDMRVGAGIKKSLFNYKPPPNAQLVENPLNMYPSLPINNEKEKSN